MQNMLYRILSLQGGGDNLLHYTALPFKKTYIITFRVKQTNGMHGAASRMLILRNGIRSDVSKWDLLRAHPALNGYMKNRKVRSVMSIIFR